MSQDKSHVLYIWLLVSPAANDVTKFATDHHLIEDFLKFSLRVVSCDVLEDRSSGEGVKDLVGKPTCIRNELPSIAS
jgi:hypothetical protein